MMKTFVLLVALFGLLAREPIPADRIAWVETQDGLSHCYYNRLTANWLGCVRKQP